MESFMKFNLLPNNALQQTFDPTSRLAAAERLSASNAAELGC